MPLCPFLLFSFCFSPVLVSYEPELHPAATYRIKQLKATIQVFSTGSITVTGTERFPFYVAIDQQTEALWRCSACCHWARDRWGLRSSCKALGTVLSQKHSVVNLVPQAMLSFHGVWNHSKEVFFQNAAAIARWVFQSVFICYCYGFLYLKVGNTIVKCCWIYSRLACDL